jgi:hypothetical protein
MRENTCNSFRPEQKLPFRQMKWKRYEKSGSKKAKGTPCGSEQEGTCSGIAKRALS